MKATENDLKELKRYMSATKELMDAYPTHYYHLTSIGSHYLVQGLRCNDFMLALVLQHRFYFRYDKKVDIPIALVYNDGDIVEISRREAIVDYDAYYETIETSDLFGV